jgi:hypothetical protein
MTVTTPAADELPSANWAVTDSDTFLDTSWALTDTDTDVIPAGTVTVLGSFR